MVRVEGPARRDPWCSAMRRYGFGSKSLERDPQKTSISDKAVVLNAVDTRPSSSRLPN